jgi:hypothetical protein
VRTALGALFVAAVGSAVFFLWPTRQHSPEDEVRLVVARALAAAEQRDVSGVTAAIADDFHGAVTRQELKQLVLGHLLRSQQGLVVLNPSLEVSLTGPTTASFSGTFVFAGEGASQYRISADLEKRQGDWVITTASWRQQ